MQHLVTVSSIERLESLKNSLNDLFEQDRYDAVTQSIGMHSILIEPEHMISDQDQLYHFVLNLLKKRMSRRLGKAYSSWLTAFPLLLARLVQEGVMLTDSAAQSALSSRHAAFGPFLSLDEFYFWALDDRRLPLGQIVGYIERTADMHRS